MESWRETKVRLRPPSTAIPKRVKHGLGVAGRRGGSPSSRRRDASARSSHLNRYGFSISSPEPVKESLAYHARDNNTVGGARTTFSHGLTILHPIAARRRFDEAR